MYINRIKWSWHLKSKNNGVILAGKWISVTWKGKRQYSEERICGCVRVQLHTIQKLVLFPRSCHRGNKIHRNSASFWLMMMFTVPSFWQMMMFPITSFWLMIMFPVTSFWLVMIKSDIGWQATSSLKELWKYWLWNKWWFLRSYAFKVSDPY